MEESASLFEKTNYEIEHILPTVARREATCLRPLVAPGTIDTSAPNDDVNSLNTSLSI